MDKISKFRQTMNTIRFDLNTIRVELNTIRVEVENELLNVMKKHNCKEVDTNEFDDTPVVIDSNIADDTLTLDGIRVIEGTKPYLVFKCSSAYDSEDVASNNISIDNLVEILEWVITYEKFLFDGED